MKKSAGPKLNPSQAKLPVPPRHLRAAGKALWKVVVHEYDLPPDALALLTLGCEAADRCADARKVLDRKGPNGGTTYMDRFKQPKLRPEVLVERDARLTVARILKQLGLDLEPIQPAPGRPAGR
jgi:phage terminase small subunit